MDARLLGRPPPSRRPRAGARRRRRGRSHPAGAYSLRVPVPAGGRHVRVGPGRGGVPPARPDQEGSWQGLLFDMTARKEAEEQLRASELVHSATVEHLPAIVYREPPERVALHGHVHQPPGRTDLRLHRRGVDRATCPTSGRSTSTPTTSSEVAGRQRARERRRRSRSRTTTGSGTATARYRWVHDEATFVARRRRAAGGRGSSSTSPSARRPRSSSARPRRSSG